MISCIAQILLGQMGTPFWQAHPRVSAGLAGVVLVQAVLIAALLSHRSRRKRAEALLRKSEERYREVVESQSEMVCRFHPDTTLTFVNEAYCRYFGKSRQELLGRTFLSLVPAEQQFTVREMVQTLMRERRPVTNEHEVLQADGSLGWLEWVDFPILDERGEIEEFQAIGRDITARRRAVEARLEAERRLADATRLALVGELAASIAHQINQPLGAILSNAEAAEMLVEKGTPEELRQILADIRRDDLRASEVIQHVRNLVSRRQADPQPVQLNAKVANILQLVSGEAQRRGVLLVRELAGDLPEILGDRAQIEQALLNLVMNGMEAMEGIATERRLLVRTRAVRGGVELSVSDSGRGISPEAQARVFDSFFTTKGNGMGLGLALVRSIAEAHRGRVSAENNPNGGATFRLHLPGREAHTK